jgi:signal transduction histidine kinase
LTRKIVELQGGTISVESEVGKVSSFMVVLPLVTAEVNV